MADGALDAGRGGAEALGNLGIEHLGDGVDHVHVLDGQDDGLAQILVALDVGGDADLMDDVGHNLLQIRVRVHDLRALAEVHAHAGGARQVEAELADPGDKRLYVAGFGDKVFRPALGALGNDLAVDKAGQHDHAALGAPLPQAAQHLQPVQLRQHQLQQHEIRLKLCLALQRLHPVGRHADDLHISLGSDQLTELPTKFTVRVDRENANSGFHNCNPPLQQ